MRSLIVTALFSFTALTVYADGPIRSYNGQTQENRSNALVAEPASLEELQAFIRSAAEQKLTVRASGASHSVSSIILSDDAYIRTTKLQKIEDIEVTPSGTFITVEAGVRLGDLSEHLHKRGYSLGFAFPAYRGLTMAGLVATGSHGSSRKHPAISAQLVEELTLVTPEGEVRHLSRADGDLFKAATANVGLLGVVYKLKFKIRPQFNLELKTVVREESDALLQDGRVNWGPANDYDAIVWFPSSNESIHFMGNMTTEPAMPGAENVTLGLGLPPGPVDVKTEETLALGRKFDHVDRLAEKGRLMGLKKSPPWVYLQDGKEVASHRIVGPSHMILLARGNERNTLYTFTDYSFSFAEEEALGVLSTIKKFVDDTGYSFPICGMYFRFGQSDPSSSFLSHAERDGVGSRSIVLAEFLEYKPKNFTLPWNHRDDQREKLIDLLIQKHKVAFHWGKNSDRIFKRANMGCNMDENLKRFIAIADELDPNKLFRPNYMQSLFAEMASCN